MPICTDTCKKIINNLKTIRFTMLATYLAVMLITLILMCVYIIGILTENLYSNEVSRLYAKANMISQTSSQVWDAAEENIRYLRFEDITNNSLAGTNIRGVITNASYNVLYDNNREANMVGKVFMRNVIKLALEGYQADSKFDSGTGKTVATAVPIELNGEIIGAVYLAENVSSINDVVKTIKTSLIVFSILIILVIGIISIGISYIVSQPFANFTETARAISKGDFSKRVTVKGMSEIAQMGTAMNYMCDELSMLDRKRRNFVSDVSHELKTPMASIKLLCDSLVEAEKIDMETVREFLGDMSEEIDRLTRLINKLLTLSRLDAGTGQTMTKINMDSLCLNIVRNLMHMAKEKNTSLTYECENDGEINIVADYDKIYESLYNIVDNAIKYTQNEGVIKVTLTSDGDNAIIRVQDNGVGIPDEEKTKIFERFYRPDDSRARDTGGTGLGLAIAKEAVTLLGGKITVEDAPGGGSVFITELPVSEEVV